VKRHIIATISAVFPWGQQTPNNGATDDRAICQSQVTWPITTWRRCCRLCGCVINELWGDDVGIKTLLVD